jgi:hypothetical protein
MTMVQSGIGKVEVFCDFVGEEDRITGTHTIYKRSVGPFRVFGTGTEDSDYGGVPMDTSQCPLSGTADIYSSDTIDDICGLTTNAIFDVALMGTLIAECRVQFADLDTKAFFFGFSDECDEAETQICSSSSGTITLSASDLCGFLWDAEASAATDWLMVYAGGTTTGATAESSVDAGHTIVEDEWDILRVEIDNNGTARWYVNGVLKQTVEGAVSTTVNLAGQVTVQPKGAAVEHAYLDYMYFSANRDWTI